MEEAPPVKGGRPGAKKDPAGRFPCVRGRNREQITVEQKFISGFRRGRFMALRLSGTVACGWRTHDGDGIEHVETSIHAPTWGATLSCWV